MRKEWTKMKYTSVKTPSESFLKLFYENLCSNHIVHNFLSLISEASNGDFYVFGGSLRRTLLGGDFDGDVDIMVDNNDDRVFDFLEDHKVSFELNRRKHRRYKWHSFQFDINKPVEWDTSFLNVTDVLLHFDLNINSLAIHFGSKSVLDPYKVLDRTPILYPGINWNRWRSISESEVTILAIRLVKILRQNSFLRLSCDEVSELRNTVLPKCERVDWGPHENRYGGGQQAFLNELVELINRKTITNENDCQNGGINA